MTDEEIMKRQRNRKRAFIWLAIISLISTGNIFIAPNPLPNPDYVPTIANGLVAATSILMAFALFSLTHFDTAIEDVNVRWRYHLIAMIYLILLFLVLIVGVMLGYRFVLTGELGFAYSCFISLFVIMCGIILDMWIVSEQFYG